MEAIVDIPFTLDTESLMKRVHIEPGSDDEKDFLALAETAQKVGKPKALYTEAFIDAKSTDAVTVANTTFTSRVLRRNLDEVERVFPFIATCGKEAAEIELPPGDFLIEFWLDTIKASLLGFAGAHLSELLDRKYGLGKTSTMSPGSGDETVWPIEQQRELFSLFGDVEQLIGVRLTDSYLMMPNKSVSGIRFLTEVDFKACQLCHRDRCSSRRAPFDQELWESMQHE